MAHRRFLEVNDLTFWLKSAIVIFKRLANNGEGIAIKGETKMDKCNERSFYAAVIIVVLLVAVIVYGVVWKMKKNTYPLSAEEVNARFQIRAAELDREVAQFVENMDKKIAEIQKELRRSLPK